MLQVLAVLSPDADPAAVMGAVGNNFGSLHSYLSPTVLLIDGDQSVQNALNWTAGVLATLSDDGARTLVAVTDITQLDLSGMATLIGNAMGSGVSFEETTVLAVAGWMYGLSPQYASKQSERPQDGETWNMVGGCLPVDLIVA